MQAATGEIIESGGLKQNVRFAWNLERLLVG